MSQSRRFAITIFSPEEGKKPKRPEVPEFLSFFTGQRERCPTTDRLHYQCYCETPKKVTLGSLIKKFEVFLGHHSFHLEPCFSTQQNNINYCGKENTSEGHHFVYGEKMEQGRRADLIEIANAIKNGVTEEQIFEENPQWFFNDRYMNRLIQAKNAKYKKTLRDVKVYYIYGPPGTGKSHYVYEQIKDKSYYQPPPEKNGTLWFDGYTGQDVLWLEDVNLATFQRNLILRLLDKYPLTCEIKGGTTQACWTTVYITSNDDPEYLDEAIQRRFEDIIQFEQEGEDW